MEVSSTTSCQELRSPELEEKHPLAFKLTGTSTAPQLSSFMAVTSPALPCPGSSISMAGDYSATASCSPGFLVSLSKVLSSEGNLRSSPMGDVQAEPPPGTLPTARGEEVLGESSSLCMRAAEAALPSHLAIRVVLVTAHASDMHSYSRQLPYI